MSASSLPISGARFAAALPDLPLSSLYGKTAELRNSIAHLKQSNDELQPYAKDEDGVCAEAIQENLAVIQNMEQRIELLKTEVESRGFLWDDPKYDKATNGAQGQATDDHEVVDESLGDQLDSERGQDHGSTPRREDGTSGGRLGDEELARLMRERMEGGDDDGVHL